MKWFKHMTYANRDEKLVLLREEFGAEGYGLYWLILETIAEQMDETNRCEVEFPISYWRKITGLSPKKLQTFVEFLSEVCDFSVKSTEKTLKIGCAKLLKIRDNHTKNLQVTYKQELELEVDIEATHDKARATNKIKKPPPEKIETEKINETDFQKIYDAGCELFPNLAPADTSSIHAWIKSGCDPCLDVIPTLKRFAGRNITTWKYFTNAIADAKATRLTPMPEGKPHAATSQSYQNRAIDPASNAHAKAQSIIARRTASWQNAGGQEPADGFT